MKPSSVPGPSHRDMAPGSGVDPRHPTELKIVSWNLLRTIGASIDDVVDLIAREKPDLMLMQEATSEFADLSRRIGGHYAWAPLPGRIHGLAMWSPLAWRQVPAIRPLPPGSMIRRVCQIVEIGDFGIANVHLSHGQRLNRRPTHMMGELVPLRIDRCLARGLHCHEARVLPRQRSDHRPITVLLKSGPVEGGRIRLRYREAAAGVRHRAAALAGFGR